MADVIKIAEQSIAQEPIIIPEKTVIIDSLNVNFLNKKVYVLLADVREGEIGGVSESIELKFEDVMTKLGVAKLDDKSLVDSLITDEKINGEKVALTLNSELPPTEETINP
jgi:hypothetical protein